MRKFISVWVLLLLLCVGYLIVFFSCRDLAEQLPPYVGRELSKTEQAEVISRNSPLASYARLTPNATFPREDSIRKITIHHMAGNYSLEEIGASFSAEDRRASANYGIDVEGNIALYVEEENRAWTSSSPENDNQAVTIEVANDIPQEDWHVSDASLDALVELCVDVCRRNGIDRLVYTGDADGTLTIHKMFTDTECPGPYLESKLPLIAQRVNEQLSNKTE